MKEKEKELLNKIFTTYNEVTKYFNVKVTMDKNNTWNFKLEKKKDQDGGGRISKIDFLIQEFLKFKEEMLNFKTEQKTFNETVIKRIDKLVKLNNLKE